MKRPPMPSCSFMSRYARSTEGRLSRGSPMPMNTTLLTRCPPNASDTDITWVGRWVGGVGECGRRHVGGRVGG